jgi:hypothetical protein
MIFEKNARESERAKGVVFQKALGPARMSTRFIDSSCFGVDVSKPAREKRTNPRTPRVMHTVHVKRVLEKFGFAKRSASKEIGRVERPEVNWTVFRG